MEDIISLLLSIRDFINGFRYMDIYVETYGSGRYDCLKSELEGLMAELQGDLKKRESKDLLLLCLDSLSWYELHKNEKMPYLNHLAEEGTCYTHAYSPGVSTSETLSAMWRRTPVIDLPKKYGSNEIPLKEVLERHSYRSQSSYVTNVLKICSSDVESQWLYDEACLFEETAERLELPFLL